MIRSVYIVILMLTLSLCIARASHAESGDTLVVFAPASTINVMERLAQGFEAETGIRVQLNLAASSTLARQIDAGAHADVYLSAHPKWIEYLDQLNRINHDTITEVARNQLVLIAPSHRPFAFKMDRNAPLADAFDDRLALGDPDHVPAGIYAREALTSMGWWNVLKDRIAPAANVRSAVHLVETGEVSAGIAYRSDVVAVPGVITVASFPDDSHTAIRYLAAVCSNGSPEASRFIAAIQDDNAKQVFTQCGFVSGTNTTDIVAIAPMANSTPSPDWMAPVMLSLKVAFISALVAIVPGIFAGWAISRLQFPGKSAIDALTQAPLVIPPVVTGYLALNLLGRDGFIGQWLYALFGIRLAFTWFGAVVVCTVIAFPLMVRSVSLAIGLIDQRLERAASTLGASPMRVFVTITLPLALPGIIVGFLLTFARSLGEFGATITFAGNIAGQTRTIPLAIYSSLQNPEHSNHAALLVGASLVMAIGSLILGNIIERRVTARLNGGCRCSK